MTKLVFIFAFFAFSQAMVTPNDKDYYKVCRTVFQYKYPANVPIPEANNDSTAVDYYVLFQANDPQLRQAADQEAISRAAGNQKSGYRKFKNAGMTQHMLYFRFKPKKNMAYEELLTFGIHKILHNYPDVLQKEWLNKFALGFHYVVNEFCHVVLALQHESTTLDDMDKMTAGGSDEEWSSGVDDE